MAANPPAANKPAEAAPEKAPAAAPAAGGGIKPWLPLLANLLLMPVLAYATVRFFILPKTQAGAPSLQVEAKESPGQAAKGGSGKEKIIVPLGGKVLVNVSGTMGTRYLLANLTLVGTNPELRALVEKNDAELHDAAAGALSVKTISDLEKPGARNIIRTELISVFNNVLGQGAVSDIYLTEFAIQ
jgi:flagellar protein FliL